MTQSNTPTKADLTLSSRRRRSIRSELELDAHERFPDLCRRLGMKRPATEKRSLRWQDRSLLVLASVMMLALLFRSDPSHAQSIEESWGIQWPGGVATALDTRIDIEISGLIARTEVTQIFENRGAGWVEAVYRFPLPEGAAVDQLLIEVGGRVLEGEIQEKQSARRIYEQARTSGKVATLVEQQRPNQFETRLANIEPGETIRVTIGFLGNVEYRGGEFSFRFPMTFTPRHDIPNQFFVMDQAPRPVLASMGNLRDSLNHGTTHRLDMSIKLQTGMALSRIDSLYHDVDIHPTLAGFDVTLIEASPRTDRMFELTWVPELGLAPLSSLHTWDDGDAVYALLMLAPPLQDSLVPQPREVIFIIDTSGSMEGESIRQARAALLQGLLFLGPDDLFNVIQFNSSHERLFEYSVPPTAADLGFAANYIDGLAANGGTNMAPALHTAMTLPDEPGHLRQIVFVTDGSVGNEHDLLLKIGEELGNSRLFTVSIGSAPNSWFMNKAAIVGRGSHTHIGRVDSVESAMTSLWGRIQSPALMDISVDWGMDAEFFPEVIPDLYAGEPLWLYAKLPAQPNEVIVSGELDGLPWELIDQPIPAGGSETMAILWARSKIESLEDSRLFGTDPEWIREQVTDIALDYSLLTQYTSLVAVDKTPVRPMHSGLERQDVPSLLPAGSSSRSTGFAPTATGWQLQLLLSGLTLAIVFGMMFFGTGPVPSRPPMAPSTPPSSRR